MRAGVGQRRSCHTRTDFNSSQRRTSAEIGPKTPDLGTCGWLVASSRRSASCDPEFRHESQRQVVSQPDLGQRNLVEVAVAREPRTQRSNEAPCCSTRQEGQAVIKRWQPHTPQQTVMFFPGFYTVTPMASGVRWDGA